MEEQRKKKLEMKDWSIEFEYQKLKIAEEDEEDEN